MRPKKIIMSAFGPYAGRVEVELDKLGQNGLYLITGDTGAGKTTIFDAITYALFGEASGDNRESSMFRSKYAEPETPTEVELYFSYAGKDYYIKRNPEYDRPKSRGEGFTSKKSDSELHLPDGRVITKVKEVNSEIIKIIGIDKNQFTQIVMIAQGDFLKLLLASTDERKKIFQKLFKTQNYYMVQEMLKTESGKLSREYETIKNSIEQYINGIVCYEDNKYFSDVCDAKNGNMTTEETVELLEQIISNDETVEKDITEEKVKLQKELDEIKVFIRKAEDVNLAKSDFEKNEADLKEKTEKQKELIKKLEIEKSHLPKIKEITEESANIKSFLPEYDELLEKENIFKNNKLFIDSSTEKIKRTEEYIKTVTEEMSALTEEVKTLEKIGEEKLNLENNKKKYDDEKLKLLNLNKNILDVEELSLEYTKAYEDYKLKNRDAGLTDIELKEKTRIYFEAQAGILADTLEEDKPCPVCGSTTHPKIAVKPSDVPIKQELDLLSEKLNKQNNATNVARTEAGKLKGMLTEKEDNVKKETEILLGGYSYSDAKTVIKVRLSDINSLIDENTEAIRIVCSKIKRKTEIDELMPKKLSDVESAKEKLTEITDKVKMKNAENLSLEKRISELKLKLTFSSKFEAEQKIKCLHQEAERIEKEYEKVQSEVNENKEKIASLKSAQGEIVKRIGDGTDINIEKEKEKEHMLLKQQTDIDSKSKTIHSRIVSNKAVLDNLLKKITENKSVEEKWVWVKALSNTANGNLSGKEKIMLETYIQMTYFDRIIMRANTRFMVMSGGQYELKRRKKAENNRSQSGLELDVIDHYNGTERSVKTLSGGESFKASLSLALGLSDEIQSSAGGIKLDTMFVDEGFGSLDDESLVQAIRALSSLAEGNRLVGIISHVSDLKDKIDKQIIVKKEKTGGSNISIVV